MRTCFQADPKNLSDYPYFAVENALLKLNIGFQVRTCFQTARREFQTASCEFQTARREFQTARREFLTVRRAFQEWFEPKNLSDYPYFAVENAPLSRRIYRITLILP